MSINRSPLLLAYHAISFNAPYLGALTPPRAAYSNSASVGRRAPEASQNSRDSDQVTLTIGCLSSRQPGFRSRSTNLAGGGIGLPCAAAYFLYAPTVTGVCPIQNARVMNTTC